MHKLQRTVLLVDDVKEDRVLIRRALRRDPKVDYQVLEAENGAQALAYLHELQPDCLLLDYQLPDTDGVTLLKTVVEQAAPHIYPVVMLTSTQRTALVVETMQQGAHDFLSKATFSAEHLLQAIQNAIEKVTLLRQLDEQREWFRLVLASISDGVITTNIEGCVTFMNPVAETLTQWTADEAQGQPLAQVFPVLDETTRQPMVDPVTQVLHTHQIVRQTNYTLLAGRSGSKLSVDYNAALIQDRLGAAIGVVITFRDITDRKAAEQQLAFHASLLDYAYDAVIATNTELNITAWNRGAEAMYGWQTAEVLGRKAREVMRSSMTPEASAVALQQLNETGRSQVEVTTHHRNGTPILVEGYNVAMRNAVGQVTGYMSVNRDIRVRKAAEDALRASEEFNRTVLESSPDCVNVLDAAGCLLMMNKPGLLLMEIDDFGPLYGQPWTQVWPAACAQQIQAALSAARRGETAHFQAFCPTAKGTPKWWDVIVAPIRNATSEVARFVVVARDITESKRAEELLFERTALLQGLIESTPTPIWTKDRAGRTTLGNQATYDLLAGGVSAQVLGHTAVEMFPDSEQARQVLESDLRVMRTGSAEVSEQPYRALDQLRFFQTTKAPLRNITGEVVGLVAVSTDITERKQAEANQQFLLDLDTQTRLLTEADAILATTVERLSQYLGGLSCTFVEINLDNDQAIVCAQWVRHDALPTLSGSYKISEVLGEEIALTLGSGQSVVITDMAHDPHTMSRAAMYKARLRVQSMAVAPFHLKGALLSTLTVTDEYPHSWRADEIALLENVIARIWPLVLKARTEQALRRQEAFVRQIADNVPGLVGYLGADEHYRNVNTTFETWFQRPRQQIIGRTVHELLGDESYAKFTPYRQQALGGETVTYESMLTYPDGVTRTIWARYQPDIAADGNVLGFYLFVMDISERKRAEARLRESEARIQLAISVGGFGFHDFNIVTGDLYWSDELYALHRLLPGTKVNLEEIDQMIHPDDRQRMQLAMQSALDPGGTGEFEQEFRIVLPDTKETLWLYNKSQTYFEGEGKRRKALRNTGIVANITKRKATEEALRASEARQAIILETMAEGVVTIDRKGRFFSANAAAERILGVPRNELIDHAIDTPPFQRFELDGTPWVDRPVLAEVAAADQRIFHHDYVIERRDGSRVVVARNITAMHATDGALLGFVSTLTDITEQKLVETALRDSEERFRAVANLVPDLLWSNDPTGVTEWHNQRWLEYNGQMLEKAAPDGWLATVHPDDRALALHNFQRAIAQGEPFRQEQRIGSATGEYRWFLVQANPFKDATGKILRWFGAATDIHEQRMARETLERRVQERTQELKTLSVIRQQLLARVITAQEDERRRIAHELHDTLGQFLSALNLRLSLLQQSVQPQDGTASPVVAELGQLWHLVNEIDSELRRLTMELRPPILDDLGLAEAIRHYAKAWSQTTAIPVDVYSTGFASAHLPHTAELSIYRIVQEALTNILKHAQATAVSVILEQRSKELQVIIEDNGIGFDPNAVGSQEAGRRALGLIGMKERVALVGGQVDLETAPGTGTTIYVHIPLITNKWEENE